MFDNIGGKIKTLATVVTIIGIAASVIAGLYLMIEEEFGLGLVIIIIGALSSWIGSFLLYGYGELIEKTTEIAQNTKTSSSLAVADAIEKASPENGNNMDSYQIRANAFESYKDEQEADNEDEEDPLNIAQANECPSCFSEISPTDKECPNCGYQLKH